MVTDKSSVYKESWENDAILLSVSIPLNEYM